MKKEVEFSCESCPVKKLLDTIWEPKTKWLYYNKMFGGTDEEYETQHICGYYKWKERCDIPGHRDSSEYTRKKYCILDFIQDYANKHCCEDNETFEKWSLPVYNGKYEDLLNIH